MSYTKKFTLQKRLPKRNLPYVSYTTHEKQPSGLEKVFLNDISQKFLKHNMFNALENSEKSDIFTQGRKWVKILYIYKASGISRGYSP